MGRIWVNFFESSSNQSYHINDNVPVLMSKVREHLFLHHDLPASLQHSIYFTKQGLCVRDEDVVSAGDVIFTHFRLKGGKGGFGSMLRAIGSQIEKTTNMEACRDLSGRRMRDVNNEKKMVEWMKEKAEKDRLKEKEKIEKLERQLQKPKHFFNDPDYEKKLESTADSVEEALKKGLTAHKRKTNSSSKGDPAKKTKLWLGDDDLSDCSDSDSSDDCFVPLKKDAAKPGEGTSSSGGGSAASNDDNKPTDHGDKVDLTDDDVTSRKDTDEDSKSS